MVVGLRVMRRRDSESAYSVEIQIGSVRAWFQSRALCHAVLSCLPYSK